MHVWFAVTPIGTGSPSVAREVARAVDAAEATGVSCWTDAAGTLLEGSWDECVRGLYAATRAVLESAPRVSVTCKFDMRTDKPEQAAADKVASLERARMDSL